MGNLTKLRLVYWLRSALVVVSFPVAWLFHLLAVGLRRMSSQCGSITEWWHELADHTIEMRRRLAAHDVAHSHLERDYGHLPR